MGGEGDSGATGHVRAKLNPNCLSPAPPAVSGQVKEGGPAACRAAHGGCSTEPLPR